jgi:hypothetical protein
VPPADIKSCLIQTWLSAGPFSGRPVEEDLAVADQGTGFANRV